MTGNHVILNFWHITIGNGTPFLLNRAITYFLFLLCIALLSSCDSSSVNDEFCECECTLKDFANPF